MPPLLEALADFADLMIIGCERVWLGVKCAWLESELEYLDRQIEKQQKILAMLEAQENRGA